MLTDDAVPGQVRWRCRRGMRELDQLLERYLQARWSMADEAERSTFLRLLGCEDDKLWQWCMGQSMPDDAELHGLVQRIVQLPD